MKLSKPKMILLATVLIGITVIPLAYYFQLESIRKSIHIVDVKLLSIEVDEENYTISYTLMIEVRADIDEDILLDGYRVRVILYSGEYVLYYNVVYGDSVLFNKRTCIIVNGSSFIDESVVEAFKKVYRDNSLITGEIDFDTRAVVGSLSTSVSYSYSIEPVYPKDILVFKPS